MSAHTTATTYNPDDGMALADYSPRIENIGRAVATFEDMGGEVYQ